MNNGNFWEYVRQGGIAIYPLALCSIVSIAIIFERTWFMIRTNKRIKLLNKAVFDFIKNKDLEGALKASRTHPVGKVYEAIAASWGRSNDEVLGAAERKRTENVQDFKKYIWVLGTVGSLAPFIGLFGTVIGIIDSFKSIAASGSGGFSVVSAGISEALIATAAGLIVAVYSVFAYNFFTVKISNLSLSMKLNSEEFIDLMKNIKK